MQYVYLQVMDIAAAITILYSLVLTNCVILLNYIQENDLH